MDAGLGMPTEEIALQGTLGSVVGVFLARPWGRLVDRVGLKRVFVWNVVAISGIPLLWVFPTRTFLLPVWADAVAVGVFWTGFNLALLTSALAFAPREGSAVFLGVYAAVFGVALGAACLVGGAVASALTDTIPAFGSSYSKYQVLFLASAALRAGAIPFVLRIPDPPGKPAAVGRALRPAASLTSRPAPGR
jgi:MFS family permease